MVGAYVHFDVSVLYPWRDQPHHTTFKVRDGANPKAL